MDFFARKSSSSLPEGKNWSDSRPIIFLEPPKGQKAKRYFWAQKLPFYAFHNPMKISKKIDSKPREPEAFLVLFQLVFINSNASKLLNNKGAKLCVLWLNINFGYEKYVY